MGRGNVPVEIGILIYPDAQLASVYGLTDLFIVANRFARNRGLPAFRVSHWARDKEGSAVERAFDTLPDLPNRLTVLIVPPSLHDPISRESAIPFASWLAEKHSDGAVLCSVCAGAFVLAETGLLAGRAATTHWIHAEEMRRRFPDVRVDGDKLLIEDGDVITAGGMMAWTDLGLKLVDRFLGATVMLESARFLLVDPPSREQSYYSNFSPNLHHGDRLILKVQHWLQSSGASKANLRTMAAHAGLEERTFLRRFHSATGLKPTEYCRHLRVGKAREMLETTACPIKQIAWEIGYEDSGAFRRVFRKVVGISPGTYRERFGLRAKDFEG